MGKVRWAGWTMAVATALVLSGAQAGRADIASDKPAAIVVYPKIVVGNPEGTDTVVRLANTNQTLPVNVHCFYLNANSHCSGGPNDGAICTNDPSVCSGLSFCIPGWQEVDFHIRLTPGQPIEWDAENGLADSRTCVGGSKAWRPCRVNADCPGGSCSEGLPLPVGVCTLRPSQTCFSDSDCNFPPGGHCTQSNVGTRIPPVPEDPFIGELKCVEVDDSGKPVAANDLKGEALLEEVNGATPDFDVASYNAIGIEACDSNVNPNCVSPSTTPGELVLGGPSQCSGGDNDGNPCSTAKDCPNGTCAVATAYAYNGCPNYLILNHFFDDAMDPVPGTDSQVDTTLTLVPCSEDLLRQIPGTAVVQYLVYNEFEQRFSTSKAVQCYQDIELCNIDTSDCSRSIFNVGVAGTLTGQTRINPIGVPPLPSALLGVAVEEHGGAGGDRSAAFNLHMAGARNTADTITLP
jgi:hypothetical protein